MTYRSKHCNRGHVLSAAFLAIGLAGCSPLPRQGEGPEPPVVRVEPNEVVVPAETATFALGFEPGTKSRYRVTTEIVVALEAPEGVLRDSASEGPVGQASELSELVFTQEILGPGPEDANTAVALVTIEQVRYVRTVPGQPDLTFDSRKSVDPNSPFTRLIGQVYTIEITSLGYVPAVFNLRAARAAVRGRTPAHAAALGLVDPPAIFPRHGHFSLPGPDVGPLTVGGRWRGVQQFTLQVPGADFGTLGTYRFEKIYRLLRLERRPVGTVAMVAFAGSPIPGRTRDGLVAELPFLSCVYGGGGQFNLDAGRVENYAEHLELRLPLPGTGSPPTEGPEGRIVVATRLCRVQRIDRD